MSGAELAGAGVLLLAVVGAVLVFGLLARRFLPWLAIPTAVGADMRLLASCPLDPRHRIVLLRCRGRDYLLILGPERAQLLDRLEGDGK